MDSIQFLTRRGATCSDLLSCLYNMKQLELDVFYGLASRGPATLDEVSRMVSRDRSTTHRCLSRLLSAGLLYKQTRTLTEGGYYHVYSTVDPSTIRGHAQMRVKEITDSLQRLVDGFETDFRKHSALHR